MSRSGMIGVAFGLGFVIGPAVDGILAAENPRLPFWVAAALTLANAVYGLLLLPESLPAERRSALQLGRANPFGALAFLHTHPRLFGLASVSFLANVAHAALPSTFVLYAGYRYGWHEREVGWALAGVGICTALVQGVLVGPIVRRMGERSSLLAGQGLGTLGFVIYGLAKTGTLFWLGVPVTAFWGVAGPAAQALMTRRVAATEQGRLQGASSSLNGRRADRSPGLQRLLRFLHSAELACRATGRALLIGSALLAVGHDGGGGRDARRLS